MELIPQSHLLGFLFGHWCISSLSFLISLINLTLTRSYLSIPIVGGEMVICPQAFIRFSTRVTLNDTWHPFITGAQVRLLWGGVCQVLPNGFLLPKAQDGSPSIVHIRWLHCTVPDEILGMLTAITNTTHCYVLSRGSPSWLLFTYWLTITWTQITFSRWLSKSRIEGKNRIVQGGDLSEVEAGVCRPLLILTFSGTADSIFVSSWSWKYESGTLT